MKQVVFRYGIYGTLAIVVLSAIHLFILMPLTSFETGEVAGYLTMILSMIFVFMGIRHYREHVNGGTLSFGQGLRVGVLIILIPSVAFGFFDLLYTKVLNPSWADEYIKYSREKILATAPADQVEKKLKALQDNMDLFSNPVFEFLLMAATVFIIGLIVTIISSLTLMKKKKTVIA